MTDSAENAWPGFTKLIVHRGGDQPSIQFHGRSYAEAQRNRDNGVLHRAVVYQTSDGLFVTAISVIQDYSNQQRSGHDQGEGFYRTWQDACAWFADQELQTELLQKARDYTEALPGLEDPTVLRGLATNKIGCGILPPNPDAAWKPMIGPVKDHHAEQNDSCHLCASRIVVDDSEQHPSWYWLNDISGISNPPPETAHPKLHLRCYGIWHSVARQMRDDY